MEILVASAVMLVIIFVLLQVIAGMNSVWSNTSGAISNFQSARSAFTVINRELARATLKTYLDYINNPSTNNSPFGVFRTGLSLEQQQTFVPYSFARASELHFVCGPATGIIPSGASAVNNPGDAVFFQAPLGVVAAQNQTTDKYLQGSLDDIGFYVQYGDLSPRQFPSWLNSFFGGATHNAFRLVEAMEPTENLSVYQQTSTGNYNLGWLPAVSGTAFPVSGSTYDQSILAQDVLLLIVRPRVETVDEQLLAPKFGETYGPATQNAIISPNYVYDSRSWQPGYTFTVNLVKNSTYAIYMRNQLPPIVDVAMLCADPNSLTHMHISSQGTPPAVLEPPASLFANSSNMDADLATFGQQLAANHIRYRIFRSSVQILSAAWVNE
ncbi:MAG TPA: hypothetical protein VHY22_01100 [Chthoniobacteraceae bacterium]|nr:hypothetical protein [Chthoniobacteraceae bacterium]